MSVAGETSTVQRFLQANLSPYLQTGLGINEPAGAVDLSTVFTGVSLTADLWL